MSELCGVAMKKNKRNKEPVSICTEQYASNLIIKEVCQCLWHKIRIHDR